MMFNVPYGSGLVLPKSQILPQEVQDKGENGVHDGAWVLELHKADEGPRQHRRLGPL